ncbi:hypothetical protein F2Q68_00026280 [Brassica cretica]|uniref:Uncharacterized protein n=1 Tax=Brassica cretica TaxID=69181 RepID=A0A8S9IIY6_BRACR|nr:hypothetical protein F2Q68_00026280 [Brassica cretica]
MDSSEKKIRRKSVEIFDDIPTDYDGQISDGLLKKPFVGKKLSVICQKLFRPTKLVGIFDVRKYRRQSSSDISDACFLSAIFDAYLPSVNSDARIRRRGPTTRSGTRALREGFTKAVQQILDRDGQTDQDQLLIEKMVQLKIQDQAGTTEVQDAAGPIQFRLNQAGLLISTSELVADSVHTSSTPTLPGSEI